MKITPVYIRYIWNCWKCGARNEFGRKKFPNLDARITIKCRRCKSERVAKFEHDPDNELQKGKEWKKQFDLNNKWWADAQDRLNGILIKQQLVKERKKKK